MTQVLTRKPTRKSEAEDIERRIQGYMQHSNCTRQMAERRVAKADLVGTSMMIKGQLVKFR